MSLKSLMMQLCYLLILDFIIKSSILNLSLVLERKAIRKKSVITGARVCGSGVGVGRSWCRLTNHTWEDLSKKSITRDPHSGCKRVSSYVSFSLLPEHHKTRVQLLLCDTNLYSVSSLIEIYEPVNRLGRVLEHQHQAGEGAEKSPHCIFFRWVCESAYEQG
jgi:hypothetical protein